MSIRELMQVVPPPDTPICAGSAEAWPEVESKLGARLPGDYKAFINKYGSGDFYDFLGILNPFVPKNDLVTFFRKNRENLGQDFFPVFPDHGGILPAGADENGNVLLWVTKGESDGWPIAYMDDDFLNYDLFDMGITQFLAEWISGRIEPRAIDGLNVRKRQVPIYRCSTPKQLGLVS